jgi:hypothetical protein
MEIQFLRVSTGQPHDLARGVTYGLELNCKSPSDCEIAIEAMGPYLVVIVTYKARLRFLGRHQRISFVEWTECRIRCVSLHPVSPKRIYLVVLAHKRDFSLEICEIRIDDNSTLTLQTVCILKLPSHRDQVLVDIKDIPLQADGGIEFYVGLAENLSSPRSSILDMFA